MRERGAWLGARNERLVDPRCALFGDGAVAGIDRHEDDISGRRELWRIFRIARLDVRAHELDPDRQGGDAPGLVVADRLPLVMADPYTDRDVGIEADEP